MLVVIKRQLLISQWLMRNRNCTKMITRHQHLLFTKCPEVVNYRFSEKLTMHFKLLLIVLELKRKPGVSRKTSWLLRRMGTGKVP